MTWAKLDDGFHCNTKVRATFNRPEGKTAIGLYALSLSFAAHEEEDGRVPLWFVESVLPEKRERQDAATALVEAGLWTENGQGWAIHDYLTYNPSKAELAAKRKVDAARKRGERK